MKINNVQIHSWTGPEWWKSVEAQPDQPLIEATITLTLSWNEYRRLLYAEQQVTSLEASPSIT